MYRMYCVARSVVLWISHQRASQDSCAAQFPDSVASLVKGGCFQTYSLGPSGLAWVLLGPGSGGGSSSSFSQNISACICFLYGAST